MSLGLIGGFLNYKKEKKQQDRLNRRLQDTLTVVNNARDRLIYEGYKPVVDDNGNVVQAYDPSSPAGRLERIYQVETPATIKAGFIQTRDSIMQAGLKSSIDIRNVASKSYQSGQLAMKRRGLNQAVLGGQLDQAMRSDVLKRDQEIQSQTSAYLAGTYADEAQLLTKNLDNQANYLMGAARELDALDVTAASLLLDKINPPTTSASSSFLNEGSELIGFGLGSGGGGGGGLGGLF